MRKALEFPRIDEGKLDAVEALIAAIADKEPGTAGAELEDLAALTGKVHTDVEFAEYWSWTDLDTLARLTLTPEPPCIPDLSREELVELVEIIQHCSVTGREWAMRYYTALLRRSLSLPQGRVEDDLDKGIPAKCNVFDILHSSSRRCCDNADFLYIRRNRLLVLRGKHAHLFQFCF